MKLEFQNAQVGQFSFRIPSAPLQPQYRIPTYFDDRTHTVRVRVQTQNQVLFDGVVSEQRADQCILPLPIQGRAFRSNRFYELPLTDRPDRPALRAPPRYVVVSTTGGRTLWSGYLSSDQVNRLVTCLKVGPDYKSVPAASLFGLPNTLGDVAAGVSVGGGLLGLAVLALAGYGVYKLVT
jgi:hypothetical protein